MRASSVFPSSRAERFGPGWRSLAVPRVAAGPDRRSRLHQAQSTNWYSASSGVSATRRYRSKPRESCLPGGWSSASGRQVTILPPAARVRPDVLTRRFGPFGNHTTVDVSARKSCSHGCSSSPPDPTATIRSRGATEWQAMEEEYAVCAIRKRYPAGALTRASLPLIALPRSAAGPMIGIGRSRR